MSPESIVSNAPSHSAGERRCREGTPPGRERTAPGAGGEIQLTDGLALLMAETPLYAWEFAGVRYDGGSPLGLLRASLEFALRREDTREGAA